MAYIDLHTHTIHSDGVCSVADVLRQAEQAELTIFSVSDHNLVSAYKEIGEQRSLFSGRILPATELSVGFRGELIEVLGYGIDIEEMDAFIADRYMTLEQKKVAEAKLLAKELPRKGVKLSTEFVEMMTNHPEEMPQFFTYGSRPLYLDELRRFPENARFFASEEEFYGLDRHRWFRHCLANPKHPLYVDQTVFFPTLAQVTEEIHRQGGLAFLAHAFVYAPGIVEALDDIAENYGLDGLECHYGTFTREQKKYLSDYCDTHGLYKSGGSDFHGLSFRPDNHMGLSAGEKIELSLVAPWLEKMETKLI